MMTRILHILDHSLPVHSGYSFRTRALMKAQRDAGHDSRALTGVRQGASSTAPAGEDASGHAFTQRARLPLHDEAEWHDGIPFYRTHVRPAGPRGYREWREVAALADAIVALCRDWRPDVLHAHSPALCGLAAVQAGRKLGIPVVYEIRAFWEDAALANAAPRVSGGAALGPRGAVYRLTRALESHVVAKADAVLTICHGLRDDLIARGVAPAKIGVMPNGVDLTLFAHPPARPRGEDDATIGFIGSFYEYEGLDILLDAMPLLLRDHPQARLRLIGGGPQAEAIRRKALGSPAAAAVQCLGPLPHSDMAAQYAQCSIMVYPRKSSRLTQLVTPLKPLEAMAQGVLVAASDVGGHRELIEHGVTGTLFAPDSAEACAQSLSHLLSNRAAWPALAANALSRIQERHDWAKNAARYERLYHALRNPAGPSLNRAVHPHLSTLSDHPGTSRAF